MPAYSYKRRFINPVRVGLEILPDYEDESRVIRPKRQTIRAEGKRRHARPGETMQHYHGMRTRQCFKIGDGRCVSVDPIEIDVREHAFHVSVLGGWIKGGRIHDLAQADGFEHGEDMQRFWRDEHGIGDFRGLLIRWEALK